MNSKILFALFFIGFIGLISAVEESRSPVKYIHMEHSAAPESDTPESSDAAHERVRRQMWGYPGYGMGMYRPYGMMGGMYRPYGMMGGMYRRYGMGYGMGMYRPYGMWG